LSTSLPGFSPPAARACSCTAACGSWSSGTRWATSPSGTPTARPRTPVLRETVPGRVTPGPAPLTRTRLRQGRRRRREHLIRSLLSRSDNHPRQRGTGCGQARVEVPVHDPGDPLDGRDAVLHGRPIVGGEHGDEVVTAMAGEGADAVDPPVGRGA